MLINDYFFLLYFLPIFISLYFFISRKNTLANIFIVLSSLVFYASFNVFFLIFLIIPAIIDYFVGKSIARSKNEALRKILLASMVIFSLSLLGYFKYNVFLSVTIQSFFHQNSILASFGREIIAPIGISFLTFQRISYIVDIYRKTSKPAANLLEYLVYATFFPQIIAGPIVRFYQIAKDLKNRMITSMNFYEGIKYLAVGLALKVLIADRIFLLQDALISRLDHLNLFLAIILILSFSFRIYFDFLGYSLLAIGVAKFVGFNFPDNFDSPYRSTSIQNFWRRWNMTLSFWVRDYVYIPLGGSRKGKIRTYVNLIMTMLLVGLWHGAGWNFIFWGGIHGIGLATERWFKKNTSFKIPRIIGQVLTYIFVTLVWIPFMFKTPDQVMTYIASLKLLEFGWTAHLVENLFYFSLPAFFIGVLWILFASEKKLINISPTPARVLFFGFLFFISLAFSLVRTGVPFIYFQF